MVGLALLTVVQVGETNAQTLPIMGYVATKNARACCQRLIEGAISGRLSSLTTLYSFRTCSTSCRFQSGRPPLKMASMLAIVPSRYNGRSVRQDRMYRS